MSIIQGNAHTSAGGGYQIERGLRFNSADSAYLNRTMGAAATNNTKTTFSCWVKRSTLGSSQYIFASYENSNVAGGIFFTSGDIISIYLDMSAAGSDETTWSTTAVFRDVSAWYHVVVSIDVSQATNANKVLLYVNGVSQTLTASQTGTIVTTQRLLANGASDTIGKYFNSSGYGNFYLTEYNVIDGQALTPSSFGETDTNTGVWKPKAYSGTYGTNGFYLKFADNSGTTSTTLGKDSSSNGNNWTPNNFSVTAGAGNDSMVDSPTAYGTDTGVGGEVRGNYATLNPLNKNTSGTLSNGNLEWQASTNAVQVVTGTSTIIPSGKTYFEVNVVTAAGASNYYQLGIVPFGKSLTTDIGVSSGNGYAIEQNGNSDIRLRLNGSSVTVSTVVQTGDVLQVAVDYATGKLWFGRNNTWYNSSGGTTGNPAAGTNETATISTTTDWFPAVAKYNTGGSYAINFGQRAFAYTAPSGFKALCTTNLPTPTIGATSTTQANDYMNVVTYTGTGSSQSVTGVGFQPDWVWIKERNAAADHGLYDAVRGVQKQLESNTTTAETTETTGLTAFGSDGFTVGALAQLNTSADTYVAWNWNAGGSNTTNTSGTITSTVRANTTSGFSIVTYTGTGSAATVGHGLGVAPSMIILKGRTNADQWFIWHNTFTSSQYIYFNTTAIVSGANPWNSTLPTSTLFSLGTDAGVNGNTTTYVAYCFASVAGYSAFGSYTGNGSTDGPFIFTNFRPRWIMYKRTDTSGSSWVVIDTARDTYNYSDKELYPNLSNAENTGSARIDILSNGYKIRSDSTYGYINASGGTYIYMALAESPFKFSLAR